MYNQGQRLNAASFSLVYGGDVSCQHAVCVAVDRPLTLFLLLMVIRRCLRATLLRLLGGGLCSYSNRSVPVVITFVIRCNKTWRDSTKGTLPLLFRVVQI